MKTSIKIIFILLVGLAIILEIGCAPRLVSISTPQVQTVENSHYTAQFEPSANGKNYFEAFRLKVVNKSGKDLVIDWNKTRYIYNGRDTGLFVFKGIQPEDIKNSTIPPETIAAGQSFTKDITPFKLLAREPLTGQGAKAGKITSGPIPAGESGIFLFIKQDGNPIKEKMTVKITEQKVKQQ